MSSSSASTPVDWNALWVAFSKKHVSKYTFRPDISDPFDIPEAERLHSVVVGSSFMPASGENSKAKTFFFLCTAADACISEEKRRRGIPKAKIFTPRLEFQSCFGVVGSFPEWSPTGDYKPGIEPDRRQDFHEKDLDKASALAKRGVRLSINGTEVDMLATEELVVDGINCGPVIVQMRTDGAQRQGWQDALVKNLSHHKGLRSALGAGVVLEAKKKAKSELAKLVGRKQKSAEDKERIKILKGPRPPVDLIEDTVSSVTTDVLRPSMQKRKYARERNAHAILLGGEGDDEEKVEVHNEAAMSFKNKVLCRDKRKGGEIARMEAARFVDPQHINCIPPKRKFNMVQMYERVPNNDDIRAWRPIPDTEKELNRGDLAAFSYTVNVIATPKAFGLFTNVTSVLVLKRGSFAGAADNPTALGDEMGFLPYVAPDPVGVPDEEPVETGFGGGGEFTDPEQDEPSRKKHRPDPGSVDAQMQDT